MHADFADQRRLAPRAIDASASRVQSAFLVNGLRTMRPEVVHSQFRLVPPTRWPNAGPISVDLRDQRASAFNAFESNGRDAWSCAGPGGGSRKHKGSD